MRTGVENRRPALGRVRIGVAVERRLHVRVPASDGIRAG